MAGIVYAAHCDRKRTLAYSQVMEGLLEHGQKARAKFSEKLKAEMAGLLK
jgi:hypothetical protein